ncbi:MAG: helix-turn-helix domain-containing protein [Desulfobacteraceae bacterium]|nr:helix-turn-helix domain-containing protein [Desulfobacteraceae bacterium]
MSIELADRWMQEREVAAMTGIAVSTLQNDRYLGQGLPYVKVGRSVRYRLKDVVDWMESRTVTPTGES